jgi:molecular chaperone GrpE
MSVEVARVQRENHKVMRKLLIDFLQVGDTFDMMFKFIDKNVDHQETEKKKLIGNFKTVFKIYNKQLAKQGVEKLESLGKIADPHLHNIQEVKQQNMGDDGEIIEVIREGYMYKEELLRDADVIVIQKMEELE